MIEKARAKDEEEQATEFARVKGKGKGKEVVYRYEGDMIEGEPEVKVSDPRKAPEAKKRQSLRPHREQLYEYRYEVRVLCFQRVAWINSTCRSTTNTRRALHLQHLC